MLMPHGRAERELQIDQSCSQHRQPRLRPIRLGRNAIPGFGSHERDENEKTEESLREAGVEIPI